MVRPGCVAGYPVHAQAAGAIPFRPSFTGPGLRHGAARRHVEAGRLRRSPRSSPSTYQSARGAWLLCAAPGRLSTLCHGFAGGGASLPAGASWPVATLRVTATAPRCEERARRRCRSSSRKPTASEEPFIKQALRPTYRSDSGCPNSSMRPSARRVAAWFPARRNVVGRRRANASAASTTFAPMRT